MFEALKFKVNHKELRIQVQQNLMCTTFRELETAILLHLQATDFSELDFVVVDLTSTQMVDSSGVRTLINIYRFLQNKPVHLRVEVPIHPITQVLHTCKLDHLLDVREVVS
jgi:anti-anti-sigma factor